MSDFIEEFYYGNIEPQECTTELKPKVMKCLYELAVMLFIFDIFAVKDGFYGYFTSPCDRPL